MYTYEEGKAKETELIRETDKWGAILKAFPTDNMGLILDDVKTTPEYNEAKANFDVAFAKLRLFAANFTRRYKKEMLAERRNRFRNKQKP